MGRKGGLAYRARSLKAWMLRLLAGVGMGRWGKLRERRTWARSDWVVDWVAISVVLVLHSARGCVW